MKPKYHVGDVLYRKDTQKKATIKQIIKFAFEPTQYHLCYKLSEPLNCGPHVIGDNYLRVDYIDSDDNYCDFKISGVPKYHAGDKIESLRNGRVVQIDLVSEHKKTHGHPWEYHVTPWLFHPNESGYLWCSHIDENTFIQKTDKDVAKNKSNRYEVGDLLRYECSKEPRFFLIEEVRNGYYIFHDSDITVNGDKVTSNKVARVDLNNNYRLATEKERQEWIESQGKYCSGGTILMNMISYRIMNKIINVDNEKAEIYYLLYSDSFQNYLKIKIQEGDYIFKEDISKIYNHIGFKNSNDLLFMESHEQKIERQAIKIWEYTYKKCLETMDKNNNSTRLIQSFIKSANMAADEFIKKFKDGFDLED